MTMSSTPPGAAAPPAAGEAWRYRLQRRYVRFMLWLVGRLLQAASAVDPVLRRRVAELPEDFDFALRVRGGVAGMAMAREGERLVCLAADAPVGLVFEFKHVSHAFLVLAFIEGTARAFANDRLYVDGDVSRGVAAVRCLDRMQAVVLPAFVARRALKTPPRLPLAEKLPLAGRVYWRLITDLFGGAGT